MNRVRPFSHRAPWLAPVVALAVACSPMQRPYHFVAASHGPEAPMDVAIRVFAANGLLPTAVDRASGVVRTRWEDTGFRYGFLHGHDATLFRQYVVTIAPTSAGNAVTVRADEVRCAGGASVTEGGPVGVCEAFHGVVQPHQDALDALGSRLRAGFSTQ